MSEQTQCNSGFAPLEFIAESLAEVLRERCPEFEKVMYTAATNAAQLYRMLDTLKNAPGAIVCIGGTTYPENGKGMVRELAVIIAVSDAYKRTTPDRAAGIWPLVQAVERVFLPVAEPDGCYSFPEAAGVEWTLESSRAADSDERTSLFFVNLKGIEYYVNETVR